MGLNKYVAIARINFSNSIAYASDSIISTLFIGLIIFIFANLWKIVYANNAAIDGFSIAMVLWYLVLTESIVTSLTRVLEETGEEVISGNISNYLNKPYNYVLYKYSSTIGNALFKFSATFIIGGIVATLMVGMIKINILFIPFMLLSCILAITLHFSIIALLSMFAFWFEDARALSFIYQKILFTVGGMLIPLEFFPLWLQSISNYLPFSYIAYYPAKLFVNFSWKSFISVISIQLLWILFFALLTYIAYNKYLKRLTVNGG